MTNLLGSSSVHLAGRFSAQGAVGGTQNRQQARCQRCLQVGHWTYECKNEPAYAARPSRTQQLKQPKAKQRFLSADELPPEFRAREEDDKQHRPGTKGSGKEGRKDKHRDKRRRRSSPSSSSSSSDDSSSSGTTSSSSDSGSESSSSQSSGSSSGSGRSSDSKSSGSSTSSDSSKSSGSSSDDTSSSSSSSSDSSSGSDSDDSGSRGRRRRRDKKKR